MKVVSKELSEFEKCKLASSEALILALPDKEKGCMVLFH
jgi:hypothetical protein